MRRVRIRLPSPASHPVSKYCTVKGRKNPANWAFSSLATGLQAPEFGPDEGDFAGNLRQKLIAPEFQKRHFGDCPHWVPDTMRGPYFQFESHPFRSSQVGPLLHLGLEF